MTTSEYRRKRMLCAYIRYAVLARPYQKGMDVPFAVPDHEWSAIYELWYGISQYMRCFPLPEGHVRFENPLKP